MIVCSRGTHFDFWDLLEIIWVKNIVFLFLSLPINIFLLLFRGFGVEFVMEGRKREKGGGRKREKGGGNGLLSFVYDFLFTQKYYWQFCGLLLVAELVLCVVIVRFVPYTEIDWEAYMQEVCIFFFFFFFLLSFLFSFFFFF